MSKNVEKKEKPITYRMNEKRNSFIAFLGEN
jgi:hypothetical protein